MAASAFELAFANSAASGTTGPQQQQQNHCRVLAGTQAENGQRCRATAALETTMMMRQTLVGLVLASLAMQAAAMHPDVLTFLRGPAPTLDNQAAAPAGRKLQQTFDEPPRE
jgi:hypothetical protein